MVWETITPNIKTSWIICWFVKWLKQIYKWRGSNSFSTKTNKTIINSNSKFERWNKITWIKKACNKKRYLKSTKINSINQIKYGFNVSYC
jgi:hypothetical protein